ncbi:UDP-N-acetylmuramoyl-L-alanyl-D-glutamate--2,6-diaminopimelate ligase [Diaphorobacter aerolatus]|uniref:UDP-N-acetylmuramoyl-L-alanyl-D-glutamate--2,6-diaminopimelate ligase n=1 Tax=Diaphorobacter aerolatus TaxID=1288495 RepID=A0A7H0GHG3_9BURK|nr:UDP-N-acetylmuramoyl-L-alanyl-D-glutamate--2,6-diaminopimelate ligase [Diaphorobacter aerolatus]QNP47729.1 UDP-N-acetylmuramoyl-L-alanyl-D-glutamate--2,6-diaminopimelate ligase [Diaphorobacter aerolatus]
MSVLLSLTSAQDAVRWLRERVTGTLQTDSRLVQPGDGFIAWPGAATDGRFHVGNALTNGATACLVELEGVDAFGFVGAHLASMRGLKDATGPIAAAWFGMPTTHLDVLAVTGTNGKTSTAWWLAEALNALARQTDVVTYKGCALVGTLGMGMPGALESTGLTTPDPVRLQRAFEQFVEQGIGACAIEASSIGLAEHRLAGTRIRIAMFTNFTQDHLDYHPSMGAYWAAKRALFDWPGLRAAVINIDDQRGRELAEELESSQLDIWPVSLRDGTSARLKARDISYSDEGLVFTVVEGRNAHTLQTQVIGLYNVSNLLGVIAALRSLGVALEHALWACAQLTPVPGRMERITSPGQPMVAVDYSHTTDALEKALQALAPMAKERGGKLWCVFGCGGNRDSGKRPHMGAVAQRLADEVVVTSDNPRNEEPMSIIEQILTGTTAATTLRVQADRALAIAETLAAAAPADVVLIAGKGHEDYQEVRGERHHFSDIEQARAALGLRGAAQ